MDHLTPNRVAFLGLAVGKPETDDYGPNLSSTKDILFTSGSQIMASRRRPRKKKRVVATSCELTAEVLSSKASCKDSLSQTTPQAKISTSLSQTTNVQVPTPLPQPLQVPVPLSQPQTQAPSQHMPSHKTTLAPETTLNSIDINRKGCGRTRCKGANDIVTVVGKISLEISKKLGRAIGNQQARLTSECGYIVRSFAPLQYKRWIDIPKEEEIKLYDRVLATFKIDWTVEYVLKCVNDTLARRYHDYYCRLKEKYFNRKSLDDTIKNCPIDVKQED
ncbi:Uncharacterized protein Adt_42484 [Abeliophyllum distichum]|uniref:Uncharacterized protein n=1 Tax=Abeliophyllum distichum TaxID=126358 RepID=A0ABD1PRT0_9LAMI